MEGNEDKAIAIYMTKEGSKTLLSKPFPTKKTGGIEDTPMHVAARHALAKLFKVFLDYGGLPGCLNARRENSAHAVCRGTSLPFKRAEIIELIFLWRGTAPDKSVLYVDINAKDDDGNTALHLAALSGVLPPIEKLVAFGADLAALNKFNLTPADTADRGGQYPVAMMLELARVFQAFDEQAEAAQNYRKFTSGTNEGKLVLDSRSITLSGLITFMNEAIKTTSQELNETAARAEVLLNTFGWQFKRLRKEYQQNSQHALTSAKIKPRANKDGSNGNIFSN